MTLVAAACQYGIGDRVFSGIIYKEASLSYLLLFLTSTPGMRRAFFCNPCLFDPSLERVWAQFLQSSAVLLSQKLGENRKDVRRKQDMPFTL